MVNQDKRIAKSRSATKTSSELKSPWQNLRSYSTMFAHLLTPNVHMLTVRIQMAVLISQQDEQIASVETKAIDVEEDTRKG